MKTIITLCLVLVLMGFNTDFKKSKNVLLVLRGIMNEEYFSKFNITTNGKCLVGEVVDYDYPIPRGIYRIESASNDYYSTKRIIITEDIYK